MNVGADEVIQSPVLSREGYLLIYSVVLKTCSAKTAECELMLHCIKATWVLREHVLVNHHIYKVSLALRVCV